MYPEKNHAYQLLHELRTNYHNNIIIYNQVGLCFYTTVLICMLHLHFAMTEIFHFQFAFRLPHTPKSTYLEFRLSSCYAVLNFIYHFIRVIRVKVEVWSWSYSQDNCERIYSSIYPVLSYTLRNVVGMTWDYGMIREGRKTESAVRLITMFITMQDTNQPLAICHTFSYSIGSRC